MNHSELMKSAEAYTLPPEHADVCALDAEQIVYLLTHADISVPWENRFFVSPSFTGIAVHTPGKRLRHIEAPERIKQLIENEKLRPYTGAQDFGHTSPDWDAVLSLGIVGLRSRVAEAKAKKPERAEYFDTVLAVYDAALAFLVRASHAAREAGREEMATGLLALSVRAPETMYEALQSILVYYALQHELDSSAVRTLGRLDTLLFPFYQKENDRASVLTMLVDFLHEIDSYRIRANMPFALGGRLPDGSDATNELTYLLVQAYLDAETAYTKFHLLVAKSTPSELLDLVLAGVKDGKNSVVFLSDEKVVEALENLGEEHADAMRYHVVGCYECGGYGELTCSCNARVNLPKALELAINGGKDLQTDAQLGLPRPLSYPSFDALLEAFLDEARHLSDEAMELTEYYESLYPRLHSAPFLSSTYESALRAGEDLYTGRGAKYGNSSLNALGLATVTDSLYAIKRLVYSEGVLTLDGMRTLLKNNWSLNERLRRKVLRRFPKYGMGIDEVDEIARRIVRALAEHLKGRPNARGGIWRLGMFSINWRHEFGAQTAASADGRLAGESLSQNTGASFGADRNGVTAHLRSVASLDNASTPNGSIADIDLHRSAAELDCLSATLRTYFGLGGFGVHYNVLDKSTLLDAKEHPERHPTLQVRLCGWNVLFSKLSEKEQDEFIARADR